MLKLKRKTIVLVAGVALLATAAVWGNNIRREISAGKEVKQMTEKMVTYCVGRYLIDLPQDTIVNYGRTRIDGADIAFLELDFKQPPFSERLKTREIELKGQTNDQGKASLERVVEFNHSPSGKMFIYGREQMTLTKGGKPYIVENVAVEAWLHATGLEYRIETAGISPKWVDNLVRLAGQLRPVAANKIPTDSGFCFERGIILDPPGPAPDQIESIVLHFSLKKYPDVVEISVLAEMAIKLTSRFW